jgi:hypothetical protein
MAKGGATGVTGGVSGVTGGVTNTGGFITTTGGAAPGAGASAGGSSAAVSCDAAWAVGNDGFVKAKGTSSCWHGYAFTGKGTKSTVMPKDFGSCGAGCKICATGTVEAADIEVAFVGINLNQSPGSSTTMTAKPTGTGLQVSFTKTGDFPLRVQIQAKNATEATRWCYTVTGASPVTIPYKSFNTKCWDDSGDAYNGTAEIEAVLLLIPGNPDAPTEFNACLEGAKDG